MPILDEELIASEKPVLVIGACGIDIVGRSQNDLLSGTSNPAYIRISYGGNARNVAENLVRLGQPAILLSTVGDDQYGKQLIHHTAGAGVDTSRIQISPDHSTGSYLAIVQRGELQFALDDMRITSAITSEYILQHEHLFDECSLLYVDGNIPPATLKVIVDIAQRSNLPVCADPTSSTLAENFVPFLDKLFLFSPNRYEAAIYCDNLTSSEESERGLQAAKQLLALGVDFAIVTLAEYGVSYATSETSGHIRAIRTEIVDPTGGGDALVAAVMYAILTGIPADESVRLGVSAATLTLKHISSVRPDLSLEKLYDQLLI
jgi:pseudouridine kinase